MKGARGLKEEHDIHLMSLISITLCHSTHLCYATKGERGTSGTSYHLCATNEYCVRDGGSRYATAHPHFHTAPHGTTRHHTAPHGTTRHHTAPHGTTRHHTAPHGTTRHHTAPHGTTRHHTAPHGTTRPAATHDTQTLNKPRKSTTPNTTHSTYIQPNFCAICQGILGINTFWVETLENTENGAQAIEILKKSDTWGHFLRLPKSLPLVYEYRHDRKSWF
jgi:hypothetical protein